MEKNVQKLTNEKSIIQTMVLQTSIYNLQENKQAVFKKILANDYETIKTINIDLLDLNQYLHIPQNTSFIDQHFTSLVYCAYSGWIQMIQLLLHNPMIDIDLQTKQRKYTALAAACLGRNYQIVKLLLDFKAEVNKPNAKRQTPLTITLNNLFQYNSFENRCICFKIAELLISRGADVDWIVDKQKGYTYLHLLTSKKEMNEHQKKLNYDIIKFLLSKGANLMLRGFDQKNPQDLVINHCNYTLLNELFENQKFLRTTKYKTQASEQGNQSIQYSFGSIKKSKKVMNLFNQQKSVKYKKSTCNTIKKNKIIDRPIFTQTNQNVSLSGSKKLDLKKKLFKFLGIKYK